MRAKSLAYLILTAMCVLTGTGCSKSQMAVNHNLIRIDIGSEVPTIDPTIAEDTASTRLAYDLFAGLVDFDQNNNVIPGMALDWEISADGKTYTFHLRPAIPG